MNIEEFNKFLINNKISQEAADTLSRERVDEEIARELTEDDLRHKNFVLADIKRIIKVIATLQPAAEIQQHEVQPDKLDDKLAQQFQLSQSIELPILTQPFQSSLCSQPYTSNYQLVMAPASKKYTAFDKETDLAKLLAARDDPLAHTLLQDLSEGANLKNSDSMTNFLIDTTVRELVRQCGNYPKTNCKLALAKLITDTWPQLGQTCNSNLPAYAMLFHSKKSNGHTRNAGPIEYKLMRLARRLPQAEKKNVQRVVKKKAMIFAAANVDLDLVSLPSDAVNKSQIKRFIEATFEQRQKMRSDGECASTILASYPKLLDYDGEMIDVEFAKLGQHLVTNIGETQFLGLLDNICLLPTKLSLDAVKDKTTRAVMTMLIAMPVRSKKSTSCVGSLLEQISSPFLKFVEPEDDILSFAKINKQRQPFLVTTNKLEDEVSGRFYVVIDGFVIGIHCFLRALEIIYKIHYIFNLEYEPQMKYVYNFMDIFLFKHSKTVPSKAAISFYEKIKIK